MVVYFRARKILPCKTETQFSRLNQVTHKKTSKMAKMVDFKEKKISSECRDPRILSINQAIYHFSKTVTS
jgi:hypothetical protein